MVVLGLTGSIGMGKSTTARFFAEAGVPVHDADAAVHRLYEGAAVPAIEAVFPGTTENGKVDRDKLATMTRTIPLAQVFEAGARILKGETRGRLVVTIA